MNNYITYGYRLVDGDMRMNPEQSEAVQLIFDAYDGGESIKKIVRMLKDRKAPTTREKPSWTPALIRKILRNKDYLGVEPYPRMIEEEQFERVQKCLKRSRDLWNQRHSSGSIQRTSMYTGRLICSSCGGVYSILTEKQLDGMFSQALMRMKTEPTLYHEETQKILKGLIKERQFMESELNVCWKRCNEDDEWMEQLYFQIAAKRYQEIKWADLTHQIEEYLREVNASTQADSIDSLKTIDASVFKIIKRVEVQPDRSLKFELINRAVVLQYPEIKTKDKKTKNIRYCVPFGYWLDGQEVPITHEQYSPIVQMVFQSYAKGMSLTALANELESQSIPNQKGRPAWSHSCIRNILTNPVYLGDKKFPALVTRELFTQVQTRLEENGRKKRESRTKAADGKEGLCAKGGTNRGGHPGNLEPDG